MEILNTLYSESDIQEMIVGLAKKINDDYASVDELLVIGILRGGVYFTTELTKRLTIPLTIDFMSVSSYGDGTVSSENVKILKDVETDIEGKHVLIVEDIIDTGRTLSSLVQLLSQRKPKSLKVCTMLNKPDRRVEGAMSEPDYQGYVIPDYFVVGYGLDYAQRYRNLPYIATIEFKE